MMDPHSFALVALVSLGMVLTPGPNMVYLVSRSIAQGRKAGLVSLAGVALGFVFYLCSAAFGLTALLVAIPFAYDTLRFAGAAYLCWLAWNALKPNGVSVFALKLLNRDSAGKLFMMGFLTNLLNPKIAIMYLSLLPQFIQPEAGHIFAQSVGFGLIQILISLSVNALIVFTAAHIARIFSTRPFWMRIQRWLMGTVLAVLAIRMAFDSRR